MFQSIINLRIAYKLGHSAKKDVAHYFGTIGVTPKSMKPFRILTESFDNDLELSYDLELEEGLTKELH